MWLSSFTHLLSRFETILDYKNRLVDVIYLIIFYAEAMVMPGL
jgi:hypothetical protein